jgi:hypothetical protein
VSSHAAERDTELAVAVPAHDNRSDDVFHDVSAAEAGAAGSSVDDAGDAASGDINGARDAARRDASDGVEAKRSSTAAHGGAVSATPHEQATSEEVHPHDVLMPTQSTLRREVNEHTVSTLHSVETVIDNVDRETAGQTTLQVVESEKVSAATSTGILKGQGEAEEQTMDAHEQHWAPADADIEEEDFDAPPEPAPQPSDSSDDDGAVDV